MSTSPDDAADAPWQDIDFSLVKPASESGIKITASGAGGMRATLSCTTSTVPGHHMLKTGTFGRHTVMCDEGPMIGGEDAYPPPMAYIALGLGWCLLTQIGRYAAMKKVTYSHAECDVELDLGVTGSVLAGDVVASCSSARTVVRVESDADRDAVIEVIRLAKQGCFGEAMVRNAVNTESDIYLNGERVEILGIG